MFYVVVLYWYQLVISVNMTWWEGCCTCTSVSILSCHCLQPLPVTENNAAKILWDFGLHTHIHVSSNRPDIVLFLKRGEENHFL